MIAVDLVALDEIRNAKIPFGCDALERCPIEMPRPDAKPEPKLEPEPEKAAGLWAKRPSWSSYRGVYYDRSILRWRARVRFRLSYVSAGVYLGELEAALAHDRKARELLGGNAKLNFPEESDAGSQ